jgi:hypothetical protein
VLAISIIVLASKTTTVNFYLLPWEGKALLYGTIALALLGLAIVLLTWRGKMQKLFLGWSLLVFVLIVRYYFFSPNSFYPDSGEFTFALLVVLAAAVAVVGSGISPAASGRGARS